VLNLKHIFGTHLLENVVEITKSQAFKIKNKKSYLKLGILIIE
jgi:hypothetical protein